MSTDSTDSPVPSAPQAPRVRITRACSSCNRQKLRCDGVHPSCGRCVSVGVACAYLPSMRGKTRKRKRTAGSPEQREEPQRHGSGTQKPEYSLWHRSSALAVIGPRNSAIWGESEAGDDDEATAVGVSPVSHLSGENHRSAPTTTLPLPGDIHNPLAILAQASATASADDGATAPPTAPEEDDGERRGYYAPLDRVLKDEAPHIMSLIDVHEAHTLFDLYHKHLHPHMPVLDTAHCSPSQVARRNNFLFNSICCVSARAFNVVLWSRLKEFARYEMERIPKEKSLDVVQGHLIYSAWNLMPPHTFEQDMTYLRLGLAARTALDIQLHRVAHIRAAREGLPRWLLRSIIRSWLMAYVADGTLSAQLGKPPAIRADIGLYVALLAEDGGREDILVASLAKWTRLLLRAIEAFRAQAADGVVSSAPDLVQVFRDQFRAWRQGAEAAIGEEGPHGILRLYDNYSRLIVQSFGLERALETNTAQFVPAVEFAEYESAAVRLLEDFGAHLASRPELLRGCPDLVFTIVTYGAVSLLRVLEPPFAAMHTVPAARVPVILGLARSTADLLGRAATSPDHLPASQAAFLSRLIQVREANINRRPTAAPERTPATPQLDFEAFGIDASALDARVLWPPQAQGPQDEHADPVDLASWLNTTGLGALPGAALGLGVGSFGADGIVFPQDSLW